MINLDYGAIAKITKMIKIYFLWTNLVVILKYALGDIFKVFIVSFMLLYSLVLRRIALEEKSFRKKRGNTRTQGKKKNKKKNFALQRMISTRKGGGDICW